MKSISDKQLSVSLTKKGVARRMRFTQVSEYNRGVSIKTKGNTILLSAGVNPYSGETLSPIEAKHLGNALIAAAKRLGAR